MKYPKKVQDIIDNKTDHVAEAEKISKEGLERMRELNEKSKRELRGMLL